MNTSNIFLTIKPSSRTITGDGSLILGVKGDNCAQRVYFECPNNFNDIFGDLTNDNIKIYVDYKNASTEPYISEITDINVDATDEDKVIFSWLITSNVTYKAGNVTFNICIKKFNDKNALVAEWHTSPFVGKVLDAVNVSKQTPEEVTPDTQTLQNLINAINSYKASVDGMNEYITDAIAEQSTYLGEFESSYFDDSDDYLAEVTKPGVYTFNRKSGLGVSCHVLTVSELLGSTYQSVFFNLNTGGFGYAVRYKSGDKWSSVTQHDIVYKPDIERKYYEVVSNGTAGAGHALQGDFVLTIHTTRSSAGYTDILDGNNKSIVRLQWTKAGTYEVAIKGYQLSGSKYLIEVECIDNDYSTIDLAYTTAIVTIDGSKIRMMHSDYITGTGDKCYLVTNL